MMSGPRVHKFTEGWAVPISGFGCAHFFVRTDAGPAASLCRMRRVAAGRLLHAGTFARCASCVALLAKRGAA